MGKARKSTRKFEKNRLKDVLDHRKDVAKIKQRQQVKEKKKARRAKDQANEGEDEPAPAKHDVAANGSHQHGAVDVDEFFQDAIEIPEMPRKKKSKKQDGDSSAVKLATKRKRGGDDDEQPPTDTESSASEDGGVALSAAGSESDSGEDDIEAHKKELQALAEKDPEFYKFLKDNDTELLDGSAGQRIANADDLSASEEESPARSKKKKKKSKETERDDAPEEDPSDENDDDAAIVVSRPMLKKWKKAMVELHSLRAMREVMTAFRAAAHINDADETSYKYSIPDADVYHELLVLALQTIPEVLKHHLPVKETASGKIRLHTESKKFGTLAPALKSHATALHHLLTTLSDAATLKITLTSTEPLLPYFLSFKKLLRGLVRTIVAVWSDPISTEATRITAFLVLRRLVVIGDAGLRETCLKTAYQGLVKGSRNTTVHTLQGVNLMKNSAAELWTLDSNVGYTTGFTFIRQLAIHLRGCITNPIKDAYKTVYNWQFVHSLDFWSRVLTLDCASSKKAERGKESALEPLIYPTVQVTLGVMRLIPTSQYFPLRFHLIRALLRLAGSTGTYIPLAPVLLEVLTSAEMRKAPKPSTLKSLDFASVIRAPTSYLKTRAYQDGVGEQVVELLSEFFVHWTKSIAFVELALPVTVMLKRWLKDVSNRGQGNKNTKLNSSVVLLVQKLEANGRWIEEHRAKVDFAPEDRAGVEAFLKDVDWTASPLGVFVFGQRKQREQQAKLVERARREEEKRRKKEAEAEAEELMKDMEKDVLQEEQDDEDSGSDGDEMDVDDIAEEEEEEEEEHEAPDDDDDEE